MRRVDLVKFSGEILKRLHENGICIKDYQHIPMLAEYERMKSGGNKTTYIVAHLSEKYDISERKVYKVLSRLLKDCQISAVI